jgi:two-component system response regulator YesN
MGFSQVLVSENGIEAFDLYRIFQPEIVITDIRMPGMDGLELSRKIRERSALTKIAILSGYFDIEYAKKAIHFGVNDYELKPVKINKLVQLVADLQNKYRWEADRETEARIQSHQLPDMLSPRIEKAIAYMNRNFSLDISIDTLADYLGITPNYFSHLFKKETGISFSEYLNRIRVTEAQKLLAQTDLKAYEVMERVGFRNYKYFNYVFKKQEGVSPADYRKNKKRASLNKKFGNKDMIQI